jgi:peptidoglycan/LPS O-acetylase OafA/YrhL
LQDVELKYRPDIDGLRAVAVLLVLVFHLQLNKFTGGFVGVDVFFVISGYLITGIIAKEIQSSSFSVARFYERRARRILPALFAVLLVSTLAALRCFLPGELISYAKSLLGATFSYSNIYFWSTADYFDAPALTKPLLHTWSLAVEEQFYLIWPLFLLLFSRRWPNGRMLIVIGLFAVSFAGSVWTTKHAHDSAFYLPFSRAWELLTGAILALNIAPAIRSRWLRETASMVGLGSILFASMTYSASTSFPGFAALLPCAGSALIIAAGRFGTSIVGKVLSFPPIVFIGLASYSIYLWHWPLIVFTKMELFFPLPQGHLAYALSIIVLSLGLGALSWRIIEQPFRVRQPQKTSSSKVFGIAAVAIACSACAAVVLLSLNGLKSRFPANAIEVAEMLDTPQEMRIGTCFITTKHRFDEFRPDLCMKIDPAKKNYLLLGDSHSAMLWYGITKQMPNANILQASVSGCNPIFNSPIRDNCGQMMRYIFNEFLPSHAIQAVFLAARWSTEADFEDVRGTVGWCRGHNLAVYVLGPVLEYDAPLPKLLAYSIAFNDPDLPERHMVKRFFDLDAAMRAKAEGVWKVHYVSIIDAECQKGRCIRYADTRSALALMGDDNHLSNAGSVSVVQKLIMAGELPM